MKGIVYFKTLRFTKEGVLVLALVILGIYYLVGYIQENMERSLVESMSWSVINKKVVIDAGHGGIDPGAVGATGKEEKEITLAVVKKLQILLNAAGAEVILTRDSDMDLGSDIDGSLLAKKRRDLSRRVELANQKKADVFLSIHVNSFPSGRWSGAQTFSQKGQIESKRLAETIQAELRRIMRNTNRVAKLEDFYTNRKTEMPSATVEIGFISNPGEEKLMTSETYQEKMAYAIYVGILKYFSTTEKFNQ